MKVLKLLSGAVLFASLCSAQFRIIPGGADPNGCSGDTPARLCMGGQGNEPCYTPPNDKDYVFGLEPKFEQIGEWEGKQLALFRATFSGCGSGTLTSYSLLIERNGELVNLLPRVELTNQSEYKLWNVPELSKLPLLTTADFVWDFKAGESHFAPHRYRIDLYVFDIATAKYLRMLEYETDTKYPGLDAGSPISVLDGEEKSILRRLRTKQ